MKIGYQGTSGAYSHKAVTRKFPKAKAVSFSRFEDVILALKNNLIDYAILPISNSNAGRVYGMHQLLYKHEIYIIGEYFLPIHHCLITHPETKMENVEKVFSHPQALAQCSEIIKKSRFKEVIWSDTAESVKHLMDTKSKKSAAIASDLAAKIYKAKIIQKNIENDTGNTTRFIILSNTAIDCKKRKSVITSVFYTTKNIPAALFKSLSGFATEGINLLSIESFMPMKRNGKARFYLEFEGNPKEQKVKRALEELDFYSEKLKILGTYKEEKHR